MLAYSPSHVFFVFVFLFLALRSFIKIFIHPSSDPEMAMNVPQIVQRWGYPVEQHEIATEDDYILTVFRIPHGINPSGSKRIPIILDHSLLCDSSEYVLNPPPSSPAMVLADAGFDVFLMNHRGSAYSRSHRTLNTTDSAYWEFTIDEHAKYDNPAVIDYVLELTGEESLYWLGHSQGAALGFTMLADRPECNNKIRALIAITPPGTGYHARGAYWRTKILGFTITKPIFDFYRFLLGSHEIAPPFRLPQQDFSSHVCVTPYINEICHWTMHIGLGRHAETFNHTRWPVYVSHLPSSTSTWNFLHWAQIATRRKLEYFDHNVEENLARYGQVSPPAYNLSLVEVPVHIFWSSADWIVTERDIEEDLLPSLREDVVKGVYHIPGYNHIDFVTATDNAEKVFHRVIEIIREQEMAQY
ncbi:hypothetical protein PMAYCL1PPCAC_22956 [Pristionchus mayeri]|uniref:Lipase n=1 Tax=Pristionchus mayeri TaxID=1317129 RepID=A0AAN5CX82_9BILA|nr:hypothetical protein PMAYCL1PPCAC_22956 [Pristionchus mayeri]